MYQFIEDAITHELERMLDEYEAFDKQDGDWDAASLRGRSIRPGTRCTEAEHRRYYDRVNRACKTRPYRCLGTDTPNQMYAKAAIAHDCATARFAYQRRCFDRSHPDWTNHETQRAQARRAAQNCQRLARSR